MGRAVVTAALLALASCAGQQLVLRVQCGAELAVEADVDPSEPESFPLPTGSCSASVERKEK